MENVIIKLLNDYIDDYKFKKNNIEFNKLIEKNNSYGLNEYLDELNQCNIISIMNNKILIKLSSTKELYNEYLAKRTNLSYEEVSNYINNNTRSTIPNCFNNNLEMINYNNPIEKGYIDKYINNLLNLDYSTLKDNNRYFEKLAFLINHRNSKRMGFNDTLKCQYIDKIIKNKKEAAKLKKDYRAASDKNSVVIYLDAFKNLYKSEDEQFEFIFDLYHENEHVMQRKNIYDGYITHCEYNYRKNEEAFKDFDLYMDHYHESAIELDADYYAAKKLIEDIENGLYTKLNPYLSRLYDIRDKALVSRYTMNFDIVNDDIIDNVVFKLKNEIKEFSSSNNKSIKEKVETDKNRINSIYSEFTLEYNPDGSRKKITEQIDSKNIEFNKIMSIIKDDSTSIEKRNIAVNYLENNELEKLYYPIIYRSFNKLSDIDKKELLKNEHYKDQITSILNWKYEKLRLLINNSYSIVNKKDEIVYLKNIEYKMKILKDLKASTLAIENINKSI